MAALRVVAVLLALRPPRGLAARRQRPCTELIAEDCEPGRFQPCGTLKREGMVRLAPDDFSGCERSAEHRVTPDQEILVQFTQGYPSRGGACLEVLLRVGECWGKDFDGDGYDCMGLCGPGCQVPMPGLCSNWSRNCLKHDVCSYYYNSAGGGANPACGYAFYEAEKDFIVSCWLDHTCQLQHFNTVDQVCAAPQPERLLT
mmetsp:Transcript_77608/g.203763  ORF Transcript_77608/g.203763 Transcript_77608/m.203763 type:complete len:201 (+) Transcript_77608:114-716(+)